MLFHRSANRDAEVFDDPERFDLSRDPNPHVGFGGGGSHFCLGGQLARSALRALFHALLTRVPDFETGEPELLGTNFMRGVKRMPFRFTPEQ
ncbi:MAG: cytochrome P450 [Pseudonocardiales bacterium]|nr:cytochrome P450 [Pseudonocardiales bacterium]